MRTGAWVEDPRMMNGLLIFWDLAEGGGLPDVSGREGRSEEFGVALGEVGILGLGVRPGRGKRLFQLILFRRGSSLF